MKFLQVLVLIFGLVVFANAQNTVLSGTVYDINKAVIPGAEIIIKDINNKTYKTRTTDSGEYKITLPFGNYIIEFSAAGFKVLRVINLEIKSEAKKTFDVTLEVGRCQDCNGALYGERWDDFAVLSGVIYDSEGVVIENAKIIFQDSESKKGNTRTSKDGSYKIKLPNGVYTIEVQATGFKVLKIEKYKATGTRNGMKLDIALDVKNCDDPTVSCSSINANPTKNK